MFKTTAIYPNRIEDKKLLEKSLDLSEEGNPITQFYYQNNLIARGYERIVYGDHSAYVEFKREHIKCFLMDKFGREPVKILPLETEAKFYYYWLNPYIPGIRSGEREKLDLKIYWQIKTVKNLPNAPKREDGKPSRFNRKEGYADYRRGLFYISPYDFTEIK